MKTRLFLQRCLSSLALVAIWTGGAHAAESYAAQLKRGDQALARHNYSQAIAAFEHLVQAYPRRFEGYQALGFARFQAGDAEAAADQFRRALRLAPKNASVQRNLILAVDRLALEKAQQQAFPEALNLLSQTEQRFAGTRQALVLRYHRGQLDFYSGNVSQGLELWKQVADRIPDSGTARFLQAYALHQSGQLDQAQQSYEAAVRKLKDDPVVLNYYGLVLSDQGHLDQASVQFTAAANRNPPYSALYLNWARLLQRQGLLEQAARQVQKLASFPASRSTAHLWLAALNLARGAAPEPELTLAGLGGPDSALLVTSVQPGCEVWLDQTYLGPAPAATRVSAGFHRLKVQPPGRQPSLREFQVSPGQLTLATAGQLIELDQHPLTKLP